MRPVTAMISKDGHIFLPVVPEEQTQIHCVQGNSASYKACLEHENKL